jgi:hypothetical protein
MQIPPTKTICVICEGIFRFLDSTEAERPLFRIRHPASRIEHRASSIAYLCALTLYKLAVCYENGGMNHNPDRGWLQYGASIVPGETNVGRRASVNRYGE